MPWCFTRCPCAGRHLLFFAAAKKSRQKKAAHTASPCSYPRAPNVPMLHTATSLSACVANALNERLTRSKHPYSSTRQRIACAAQVANCVQVVASYSLVLLQCGARALSVRSEAWGVPGPTQSLPPGRRWTIWRGMLQLGSMKWVRRIASARATDVSHVVAV